MRRLGVRWWVLRMGVVMDGRMVEQSWTLL